jgi:hypothetical protein
MAATMQMGEKSVMSYDRIREGTMWMRPQLVSNSCKRWKYLRTLKSAEGCVSNGKWDERVENGACSHWSQWCQVARRDVRRTDHVKHLVFVIDVVDCCYWFEMADQLCGEMKRVWEDEDWISHVENEDTKTCMRCTYEEIIHPERLEIAFDVREGVGLF